LFILVKWHDRRWQVDHRSTVARHFAEQRRLGASFFFSQKQGDLGHAGKFFTTIAWQLAHALPTLKRHICEAIAQDHQIGTRDLNEQWRKLIFQPLSEFETLSSHSLPIVLVVDELDQCGRGDPKDVRLILRLLAEAKDLPKIQLRIFLTSRPEAFMNEGFGVISKLAHQDFSLDDISNDIIEHDILIFVQYELERIRRRHSLPLDWPESNHIRPLAQGTHGMFGRAAILCQSIDRPWAKKQLSAILQRLNEIKASTPSTSSTPNGDNVYS
jgi:hypothetical protein